MAGYTTFTLTLEKPSLEHMVGKFPGRVYVARTIHNDIVLSRF